MDPLTIMAILSGLQTAGGLAGMFRKKPKAPKFPEYRGYSPELKARILEQIKGRIGSQTKDAQGTLEAGAIRRGFGQSGQMGQIARDVTIAGNKDYSDAVTGLERSEADRYQDYIMARAGHQRGNYGTQMGEYGMGSFAAGGAFGGGLSALYELLMKQSRGGAI